jgi:hypothetical protein
MRDFYQLNNLFYREKLQSIICFSYCYYPIIADNQGRDVYIKDENRADILVYIRDKFCRRLFISEAKKVYLADI